MISRYAELYGIEIVAIETDSGISGKTMDRPGLQRALAGLSDGAADAIIVSKLDRLTRSVCDLGYLIDAHFGPGKFALHSVSEKIDTSSAAGRFLVNILGSVAQWERETIGERTKVALAAKKARGEKLGGCKPFGYRVEAGKLVPDEMEQAAILDIRGMAARGRSTRVIAQVVSEEYGIEISHSTVAQVVNRAA